MTDGLPSVSVLVCSSGRPDKLSRLVDALATGDRKPEQLVVVNGIQDGSGWQTTSAIERRAGEFEQVVVVEHPNRNLASLRNLGIPHCTGDVVAFTDDDAVPDADWVFHLAGSHALLDTPAAVGGTVRGMYSGSLLSRIADVVVFPPPVSGRPVHTLPTVNMSYSRDLLDAVGDFDVTLFRGEDVDYNWRVIQAGVPITFEPAMRVLHEHRATLIGLYRQQYMYGRAYVLVRRKWPAMYSVYPRSLRTSRDWAKLVHSALAVLYQPLLVAKLMKSRADQIAAYPILVGHHFIWKAGMVRQALASGSSPSLEPTQVQVPVVREWRQGEQRGAGGRSDHHVA